jgi:NADP-reducing hydrogenase subunit HndB
MGKLAVADLDRIARGVREAADLNQGTARARVTVHMGTCGLAAGAGKVMATLLEELEKRGWQDVVVTSSGCAGLCSREPMVTVQRKGEAPVKYGGVDTEGIVKILEHHIQEGKAVEGLAIAVGCETVS